MIGFLYLLHIIARWAGLSGISAGAPELSATAAAEFPQFPLQHDDFCFGRRPNARSAAAHAFGRRLDSRKNHRALVRYPLEPFFPIKQMATAAYVANARAGATFGRIAQIGNRTRHNDPVISESFNGTAWKAPPYIVAEKITRLIRTIRSRARNEIASDPQEPSYSMLF